MHNLKQWLASLLLGGMLVAGWAFAQTVPAEPSVSSAKPTESFPHRLLGDLQHEIAAVEPWLDRYGYGAVFAAVGVEGFGIPAPGQTLLIAGAVTAATQTDFHIGLLLLTAFLAAILGSSLGYLIGRRGGRVLLHRFQVDERHWQRVEQGFSRYGGGLIVVGRFFDGLRQLNGIAAGILEMPWWTFTAYNALGAALWVGCWGLGIYYLDENLYAILGFIRKLNPWVATATLIGITLLLAYGGYRWQRQHRAGS
ncbi:MAG TPA: DedA family protein [Candidatus Competibacteraceae bacterium]|nr:DedA family protein [Candidatus Competibacteraceae bacterium]HRZ07555.1 DedA family protein [Candidatus Competibacteraceae bacterium]HSA48064.1 DedA family protein [Candidatus Competibacteraceae bacterium]